MPHGVLIAADLWHFVKVRKCDRHIKKNARKRETKEIEDNVPSLCKWYVRNVKKIEKFISAQNGVNKDRKRQKKT